MRTILILIVFLLAASCLLWGQSAEIQFLVTSDSHYGITRSSFRGTENADSHVVNAAMVAQMNRLPDVRFPSDGGLRGALPVGAVDFVVDTGDIANREETAEGVGIQNAATSWSQFRLDYVEGLSLRNRLGELAPLFVVPGNHDASNSVGSYKAMNPAIDKTSMVQIFNHMMNPTTAKTTDTFDDVRDKVMTSRNVGGVHFIFVTLWPDSRTREWMAADLAHVTSTTPTVVFAHDPPDSDSKHFINPNGNHDINKTDKFENVLSDVFADSASSDAVPILEQQAWEDFLRKHSNVT